MSKAKEFLEEHLTEAELRPCFYELDAYKALEIQKEEIIEIVEKYPHLFDGNKKDLIQKIKEL